ncbi:MAG: arsenite efflux transporter metallochaperone ArsD [Acidimicrobiales bacterium]
MTTVEVFDPPMCCSTGVCGPSVDPALAAFAADLGRLSEQGVVVERHNLSQEPKAFAERDLVRELLAERGDEALPAVVVDGVLRSSGRYPSWVELEAWAREAAGTGGGLDASTAELVAMGAAVGANCEPCFSYHYDQARRLGVARAVMAEAVRVAQAVKDTPARSMAELAAKLLDTEVGVVGTASAGGAVESGTGSASDVPAVAFCGEAAADPEDPVGSANEPAVQTSGGCCGGGPEVAEVPLVGVRAGGRCCG